VFDGENKRCPMNPLLMVRAPFAIFAVVSSGEKLFRAANEPKTFVKIPGADHNNWLTDVYLTRLDEFIDRIASEENRTSNH
jgi:hypothetical protein